MTSANELREIDAATLARSRMHRAVPAEHLTLPWPPIAAPAPTSQAAEHESPPPFTLEP